MGWCAVRIRSFDVNRCNFEGPLQRESKHNQIGKTLLWNVSRKVFMDKQWWPCFEVNLNFLNLNLNLKVGFFGLKYKETFSFFFLDCRLADEGSRKLFQLIQQHQELTRHHTSPSSSSSSSSSSQATHHNSPRPALLPQVGSGAFTLTPVEILSFLKKIMGDVSIWLPLLDFVFDVFFPLVFNSLNFFFSGLLFQNFEQFTVSKWFCNESMGDNSLSFCSSM